MAPNRQSILGDASSPVNHKKTKLSASHPRAMRNVVDLMRLPLPNENPPEIIDASD